ncbi:alpha/beta fold hydrolase [Deinococcus humi]|uniref:Pimeloyl-ACP methyl ester carboxylesterase n=1 Tax=Deinococcus humi TaxID=662880 RepID=A0A7W8JV52_9DEIO|nr:alpha/beta hydrolase [Deinococcus humi]MBB5363398.1 pimeloyl-ACP methyl ester carboxylesterase [Deinococcus humi]
MLRVNGVLLHVVEAGPQDGPLVVLLHGFPEFWYGWRRQIEALANAGYRVLAPDQRGYNLSEKPPGMAAYRIDALTRDVLGLLDARGRERAYVVGHDWGAAVAWNLAISHPERVERLAILNVPHPGVFAQTLRTSRAQQLKSWYMFFFQVPVLPEVLLRIRNFRMLARSLTNTSRSGTFSSDDLKRYREAWAQPGTLTGMLNWYRAMFLFPAPTGGDARVRVPALILWGAEDQFLGREMAERSVEHVDDAQLEMFGNVSHWIQHEVPQEVNAHLLAFFAGNRRGL